MIHIYSPNVLIVHNEYSYTSSLLTDYCHKYGVKHIDVMYGEKLAIIRDAYFHYDETYVWNQFYADLFISQKAEPTQFKVALPESMMIDVIKHKNEKVYADYKYYLAITDETKLQLIAQNMAFVSKEGKSVKYRLHPRYTDTSLAERILGKQNIEYPREVGILESISNCGCAVSEYSTVLNQAYNSGIPVLIDDVADPIMFEKLKSFKYSLIIKGLPCLSSKQ